MTITQDVTISSADDEVRALATITTAFVGDPIVRWFIADPASYVTYWPSFARALGGLSSGTSAADAADDFAGVALWIPPGVGPDEDVMEAVAAEAIPSSEHDEKFGLMEQMGEFHPDEPHWYLPLIGVDHPHIGRGLGSALLRHGTARADQDGAPCYLEATSLLNKRLYERHGFEEIGLIQSGDSPPMWPMVRKPR